MKRAFSVLAIILAGAVTQTTNASSVALTTTPTATFSQGAFGVGFASDGSIDPISGWAIDPNEGTIQSAVFNVAGSPVTGLPETEYTFTMYQIFASPAFHNLGDFRFAVTSDAAPDANVAGTWSFLTNVTFSDTALETPVSISPSGEILLPALLPPAVVTYTVTGRTTLQNVTGFRLEVIPNASLPNDGPGRQPTNGNFVLSELQVSATAVPVPSSAVGGFALLAAFGAMRLRRWTAA